MKYFVYCRKSSESEDRQVLSLESQEAELKRAFGTNHEIVIKEWYHEAYSAKDPGRPKFNQMLERIERGEADGIIAWHPDRLARNSIDGGRIIYLLDQKKLRDLRFATYTFENNPQGKFMLSIIFGYSKYYVDSLSENVKRGNRTKVENGWRPNQAPLGYLNNKETKTIVRDPLHFPLIRQMYELMLTGIHTPKQIALIARDEWGFRTPKKKRIGGTPLAMSSVYKILTNPFYAGLILWKEQTYPGKHEPVVSIEEFDRVQMLLGRPGRPRSQKHHFTFTGMVRCGECGLMVTAEEKINRYGRRYVYYHCTKRRLGPKCAQPYLEERAFESQVARFLAEELTMPGGLLQITIYAANAVRNQQESVEAVQIQSLEKSLREVRAQLAELTGLRVRNMLSDEEFLRERQRFQREELALQEKLIKFKADDATDRFEPIPDLISFRNRAVFWFQHGDPKSKRLILETVGSNLRLKDKRLSIEAAKCFRQIGESGSQHTVLAYINDVRTLIQNGDAETKKIIHNINILKKMSGDSPANSQIPLRTEGGGIVPDTDSSDERVKT